MVKWPEPSLEESTSGDIEEEDGDDDVAQENVQQQPDQSRFVSAHGPRSMHTNRTLQVKSTLLSRIDLLEKTLVFRPTTAQRSANYQRGSPPGSRVASRVQANHKVASSTSDKSREFRSVNGSSEKATPSNRNIRKELAENKFGGLAALFQGKMSKIKLSGDWSNADKEGETEQEEAVNTTKQKKPKKELKQTVFEIFDDSDQFDTADDNYDEEDEEQSNMVSSFGSFVDEIAAQLYQFELQHKILSKVSFVLRDFYEQLKLKNWDKTIAQYRNELVTANKRLLVSEVQKSRLEREIEQIQARFKLLRALPYRVRNHSEPGSNLKVSSGRGCFALASITIQLRRPSSNAFVLCLVHDQFKLAESKICNVDTLHQARGKERHHTLRTQFDINELFEELEPNFEISIEFYQMILPFMRDNATFGSLIYRQLMDTLKGFKSVTWLKNFVQNKTGLFKREQENNNKKLFNHNPLVFDERTLDESNTDLVPLVQSAFKSIGSLTINRSNWSAARHQLDPFDCLWSLAKDRVAIKCDLTIDYGREAESSEVFGVYVECRPLSRNRLGTKQLNFNKAKFKFVKSSVKVDKNWLKVRSKRGTHKFDLACCLNPKEVVSGEMASNAIGGGRGCLALPQHTICFIFVPLCTEPDIRLLETAANKMEEFQFVFTTSRKADRLGDFNSHLLSRVHSVRQWHTPARPKSLYTAAPNGTNLGITTLYSTLMHNLNVN